MANHMIKFQYGADRVFTAFHDAYMRCKRNVRRQRRYYLRKVRAEREFRYTRTFIPQVSKFSSNALKHAFISGLSYELALDPLVGPGSKKISRSIIPPRHFRFYTYTLIANNLLPIIMKSTEVLQTLGTI